MNSFFFNDSQGIHANKSLDMLHVNSPWNS